MRNMMRFLVFGICVFFLVFGICEFGICSVDIYLAPTRAVTIIGNSVTYSVYIQADVDTKLEALGDVFLAYDKTHLKLITENVKDLATHTAWTGSILDLDYNGKANAVSENIGVVRFAKVSLHDQLFLTANVPVEVLALPFEIQPSPSFSLTRLYFISAIMIDDTHKNVLRNATDSFLIKQDLPQRPMYKGRQTGK